MRCLPSLLVLVILLGCSTRRDTGPTDGGPGLDGSSVVDAGSPRDSGPDIDAGPLTGDTVIYAHSRDTLFSLSPTDLVVTEIGPFRLPDGSPAPYMLDLAVDADGNVYTSSDSALFTVDPETATATEVGDFGLGSERLFALSFLAPGEYAEGETLIGATNEGAYYEVDRATARATLLGQYPDGWQSSGDIVSVAGLGTFATVRRTDFPSDVLVQIVFSPDGSSTTLVKGPIQNSSRNFTELFGVGYWGRVLYGFSNMGELIEIDRDTGRGTLVTTMTGTSQFWGAGVTTRAYVLF
jgi:hypothetical protein